MRNGSFQKEKPEPSLRQRTYTKCHKKWILLKGKFIQNNAKYLEAHMSKNIQSYVSRNGLCNLFLLLFAS